LIEYKQPKEISLSQKSTSAKSNKNKSSPSEDKVSGLEIIKKPELFQIESQLLTTNEISQPFQTIDHEYKTSPLPDVTATSFTNGES
jgi:hypothetical protein